MWEGFSPIYLVFYFRFEIETYDSASDFECIKFIAYAKVS